MFDRLKRSAPALLIGLLVAVSPDGAFGGAEKNPGSAGHADIELRKSFRFVRRPGHQAPRPEERGGAADTPGSPYEKRRVPAPGLGAVADALGEQLQSSGALHLPGVGEGGVVLDGATTPIMETASGRHLIIDRDRTIDPGVVDEIARRWPAFSVVQPPAGGNLHDFVGSVLDAAGYDSVLRRAPLIFSRGVTVRFTPDFVVLRSERDLVAGETRAISIVEPFEALPPELRELAGEHRVHVVELTPEGAPAGAQRAPWRDPAGRVTTMETSRSAPIIEEIASAVGLTVERRVRFPADAGEPGLSAALRLSLGGDATYVFENPDARSREILLSRGDAAITLNSSADLTAAVGALLRRFGIEAIGPVVEFYRAPAPGAERRFVISVPGWLAAAGGRRLLITGAPIPLLVRLYLTREGVDIFEYRVRDGR